MRLGSVEIHAALLVLALVFAWRAWTAEGAAPESKEDVVLWDVGTVDEAHFVVGARETRIAPKSDESGSYLWVTTSRPKPAPKAPGHATTPAPASTEVLVEGFPANERGPQLLRELSRLMARRSLGVVSDEDLAEMKLDEKSPYLEVLAGGKTHRLQVGMAAYGGGLRYVRKSDGVVYVVDQQVVDRLRLARSQLRELRLLPFKADEITDLRVSVGASKRDWEGQLDTEARTFLAKLIRLHVQKYVQEGESIQEVDGQTVESSPVMSLLVKGGDREVRLEMLRFGEGKKARYYARSTHTHAMARISGFVAAEIEKDLPSLLR